MGHTCHAEGCTREVPPKLFACLPHWRMVPNWLQKALWGVYQHGQEDTKVVTPQYIAVQIRCRIAIAEAEGNMGMATRLREILDAHLLRKAVGAEDPLRELSPEERVRAFDAAVQRRFREQSGR